MTVSRIFSCPNKEYVHSQRGGGLIEVLLAFVIVAVAAPFTYSMISDATRSMHNMAIANDIISLRSDVLNFVRMNQDLWPASAQIKLSPEELSMFSSSATTGFIDKYSVKNGTVIDVYLMFDFDMPTKRVAQIAKNLGGDAAVVGIDGVAYGDSWAATAPDFKPGHLVYKISRDVSDVDTEKFLHRGSSGPEKLNMMERDLNMGGNNIYNVGGMIGKSLKVSNVNAMFLDANDVNAENVYFSGGAEIRGDNVEIDVLRVMGDIIGFRNIEAHTLNSGGFTTNGHIVADRVKVAKSVNVGRDLVIKSDSLKTIGAFTGISAGTVYTPYIHTDEITFYQDFGLTVSGELLVSTNPPIRFGSWAFPSYTPPLFHEFKLKRASIPDTPTSNEFKNLFQKDWKNNFKQPTQPAIPVSGSLQIIDIQPGPTKK